MYVSSFSSGPNRLGLFIVAFICGGKHGTKGNHSAFNLVDRLNSLRGGLEKLNKLERKEKNPYHSYNRSRNIQQDVMVLLAEVIQR